MQHNALLSSHVGQFKIGVHVATFDQEVSELLKFKGMAGVQKGGSPRSGKAGGGVPAAGRVHQGARGCGDHASICPQTQGAKMENLLEAMMNLR